jgi:hypothetical protein
MTRTNIPVEEPEISTSDTVIATEDAKAMLQQDRDRRVRGFASALRALQEQYRVRLDWVEVRRNGRVERAVIEVVALD